jgi:putative PIN family toxin of toxin-antitoxin system
LDSNVFISAIMFGGVPLKIVDRLFQRDFSHVTGPNILREVRSNLVLKFDLNSSRVNRLISDIVSVSSVITPGGNLKAIAYGADNLVLELCLMGGCDILVTGDKKHLLPLNPFQGVVIEPPSQFLKRLDQHS